MSDWTHVRTRRLWLDRPVQDDLADLHLDREPDAALARAIDEQATPRHTVCGERRVVHLWDGCDW